MSGRPNKPWYRAARGEWFVKINGVQHRLGPDKDEAERRFHLLMASEEPRAQPLPSTRDWKYSSEIIDEFQIFIQRENSESTLKWYCRYLDPFKKAFLKERADKLSVDAVRDWVCQKWKTASSRRAFRCIKSAFRKAMSECKLMSPIAAMRIPEDASRDHVVTKKDYQALLSVITDSTFADLIKFVWLTGARPQEALIVEDAHVDLVEQRIVLPAKNSKGKKRARVIYLTAEALKLVKTKMGFGRLFRNEQGRPYDKDIVSMRFRTLEKTVKFRYCLYHFRHAFAYRSLVAGVDALTVATLMGHTSTRMLEKVYGHLMQAHGHLRKELAKTK